MKIKIQRSVLLDGLKKVQSGANGKTAMPILANVLLDAKDGKMRMTTTNLDLTLETEVDCEVIEAGAITAPMRMLFSIVSAMIECEVAMESTNSKMVIRGGNYVSSVSTLPANEFPRLANDKPERSFSLLVSELKDIIRKTAFAQSVDETRRTLTSVLFEFKSDMLRGVATDGRRLAIAEVQGEFSTGDTVEQIIIPSNSVFNLQKFLDGDGKALIDITKNQVSFSLDDNKHKITTKLVDGVYPAYAKVVPKDTDKVVILDREELIGAVERVSVMATREDASIQMTFSTGKLLVEVKGDDYCDSHDEIPIKYDGEMVAITFNPKYVLDPLKASNSDEVKFELKNGASAANVRSCTERFLCTMMPKRMS